MDDLGDLVTRAAREAPDRVARRRGGRPGPDLGRAGRRGVAVRHRARRGRCGRRAPGAAGARQPARAGDGVPRHPAGPGRGRPGQPALDGERAGADDRRLGGPDCPRRRGLDRRGARGVATVDAALAGVAGAMAVLDADQLSRAASADRGRRPGRDAGRGGARVRRPARRRAAARAAAAGPREARGAPLHQRRDRSTAGRDAHAPGAAGQHRAGGTGRAADDPRRRRRSDRAAALPRLRAQRGPRRRRAARRDDRAAAGGSTRSAPSTWSPPGAARCCRSRPRSSGPGSRCPTCASGSPAYACVLSGSAPLAREVAEEFETATGLAVHQGYGLTEAAPVVTSTLRSAHAKPGSVGAALDGVELRLVDEHGVVLGGRRPRRDRGARAPTCSAATGPTATTAPAPTAGGRQVTWGSSTRTGTCSWSTGSRSSSSCRASTSIPTRSRTSSASSTAYARQRSSASPTTRRERRSWRTSWLRALDPADAEARRP